MPNNIKKWKLTLIDYSLCQILHWDFICLIIFILHNNLVKLVITLILQNQTKTQKVKYLVWRSESAPACPQSPRSWKTLITSGCAVQSPGPQKKCTKGSASAPRQRLSVSAAHQRSFVHSAFPSILVSIIFPSFRVLLACPADKFSRSFCCWFPLTTLLFPSVWASSVSVSLCLSFLHHLESYILCLVPPSGCPQAPCASVPLILRLPVYLRGSPWCGALEPLCSGRRADDFIFFFWFCLSMGELENSYLLVVSENAPLLTM